MDFLRNPFGKKQSAGPPSSTTEEQQPSEKVVELQKKAEEKIELLRYLTTSGKFDRDKMVTYISMLEQFENQLDPQKKSQMLNAGELIMPKLQSNGKAIDGFEQLRQGFMDVHMEELTMVIKLVGTLPPELASVQLVKHIIDETGKLQYKR